MRFKVATSTVALVVVLIVLLDQQQSVEARRGRGRGRTKSRVSEWPLSDGEYRSHPTISPTSSGTNRTAHHRKIPRSRVGSILQQQQCEFIYLLPTSGVVTLRWSV